MNCKPGDMAVVTQAMLPQNIGLIVEVLNDGYTDSKFGWTWKTKSAWPASATNNVRGLRQAITEAHVHDAWLRPIRPPETPLTETRDEELTA